MKRISIFVCALFSVLCVSAQVTVHVNSGNPRFPFPQFLSYSYGSTHSLDNLGTQNPEGVVHAEMEKSICEAYQIFANEFAYTGDELNGVKYIRGNLGMPYDGTEGTGYSLLAAAIMGDKTTYDGLWLRTHDTFRGKTKRYLDCTDNQADYAYGLFPLAEVGGNTAADGDVDIALATYIAWRQWGDYMGINDACGNPISYKKEMIEVIRGLVALSTRFPTESPQRCNSGDIGLDGYMKNGDTWTEETSWATDNKQDVDGDGVLEYPEYGGPQTLHVDYSAPAYFKEFYDLLQVLDDSETGSSDWEREQFLRATASCDWFVGNWISQSAQNIPFGGWAAVSGNNCTWSTFQQGEDFRAPWRTILNYVWHGNPDYSWNPSTHSVTNSGNTYEYDGAVRYTKYMNNPQDWNSTCTEMGGGPDVSYKGPLTLQWDISPSGKGAGTFTLNWIPACGTPAAVASQDLDLLGLLYRQCEIEWDVSTAGDGYLSSKPVYFHGWFRLLGMLIATGNHLAPGQMAEAKPNLKIYRSIEDSLSYAYTGDSFTYYLDYRNYGSVDASGTTIVEHVPEDFIFVSAANGGVYDASSHTVTWNIGTVPGFKTGHLDDTKGQVSYVVKVGPNASGRYCTTAEISCDNGLGWTSNEYPNFVTATMQRNCVDVIKRSLVIEKTANLEEINPGNVVTYTINFENSSEAGWLDGGRPRVGIAFANTVDNSQNWLKFRLYNDAIEPYINYGNYRISYYIYDSSMKCLAGEDGCATGWAWYTAIYEGKRVETDKVTVSHETVVEGEDDYGKWNQRMMIQFAPLLVTTTAHLSNYFGMGARIHRGGTQPLRVAGYLYPSNYAATDYTDDWSWDASATDADDGLFYPVTPSWQEIDPSTGKSIEKTINEYIPSVCETPTHTVSNVLVEEYDGYAWRRVLGTGPMAGRDASNVVVCDTLPKGLDFVAFQNTCPLSAYGASWTTTQTSDGRDVVIWTIPTMQIKQKGSIIYTATATFPSGATCQTEDEDIDNVAWIYADLNSPIGDTATITVTCAKVPTPIEPTTLTKTPSSETVSVGDEVTYTLEYEQTHGFVCEDACASPTDWTCSNASVSGSKVSVNSNVTATAQYNMSYAKNSFVEFDCSLQKDDNTYFLLRDKIQITLRPEYATMKITCTDNGTEKKSVNINSGGASSFHVSVDVTDDILRLWVNNDTTNSADFTVDNLTTTAPGYFIIKNTTYGSPSYTNVYVHSDYAYNLSIVDELPSELTYVSSDNSGVYSNGEVTWTFEQGKNSPIAPGKKYTVSVTTEVVACDEKIINEAHVNLLGHADDEIRAQAVVECGAGCPSAPKVTTPITYCQGDEAEQLTATGTALQWYTAATGGTGTSTAPTPSTETATTTSYYVSQTENGCESARAEIEVVVNAKPSKPTVTAPESVCAGESIDISAPLMADATYAWTGPDGFTSTDRQVSVTTSATADHAGEYHVIVTSQDNCASDPGTATIVVNEVPSAPTITTPIQYCYGESVSDEVTAEGSNLKWYTTEDGTAEYASLVPATTAVGSTHYYVSQTVDNCESPRADLEVQTLALPTTPSITTNSPVCVGSAITLSTDAEGIYAWSGPNGFTSDEQNPEIASAAVASAGEYSLTVTVGTCTSEASTATVVVNTVPETPTPSNNGPKCEGEDVTLSIAAVANAIYTWSGPDGFTSEDQNPTTKTAGEYSLTVTVAGCTSKKGTTTVVINEIPQAPTVTSPIQYCKGESVSDEVTATGSELKWYTTEDGSTEYVSLVPVTTTVGTVHYYVSQTVDGCESPRADLEVQTLEPPTTPAITTNSPVCAGKTLTLSVSAEGVYSWSGPNNFTSTEQAPSIAEIVSAAAGEYTVVVTVGNCKSDAGSTTVVVNPVPEITIDPVENQCEDGADVSLVVTAVPTGGFGSFSGNGISGLTFSPSTAGEGTHTITYTYQVNGCSKNADIDITVQAKPDVSFVLPTTACKNGSVISLEGTPSGGTFTTSPSIDLTSGFNPSNATVGQEYTITYTYSDGICSNTASNTIEVFNPEKPVGTDVSKVYTKVTSGNVPALTATGVNQIWYSDEALTVQVGTGSSYTPDESVVLEGGVGKVGTYTYYVVSTEGGCVSEKTAVTLEISSCAAEAPVPVNNVVKVCYGETDDAKKSLSVTAGAGNIRWYYNDTKEQDDALTTFIPSQTEAGSYVYYVSLYDTDANCESGKSSITYIINDLPTVSFDLPTEVCEASATINFDEYKSQASGIVTDESDNEITSYTPTSEGTYTFTYSYTDANSCTNTVTDQIVVLALPEVTITAVPDKCEYDESFDLSSYASPSGGVFMGEGVSQGTTFNPSSVTPGSTVTLMYTYTDAKSCVTTETFDVSVIARPTITFNAVPPACVGATAFDLLPYVNPTTGTFVGEHISGTIFNPEEKGSFDVVYTVESDGCSSSKTSTVVVNALPEVQITIPEVLCKNTGDVIPTLSPAGGTLSIDGSIITAVETNSIDADTYTLLYVYTDENTNCSNNVSKDVELREIAAPIVTDKSVVITSTDLTITATGSGGTLEWTDENGTKTVGETITHPSSAVSGSWQYCVTETDGTCTSEEACMTFTVIDCPTPKPTVTVSDTVYVDDNVADVMMTEVCASEDVPTFFVTAENGALLKWYGSNGLIDTDTPEAFKDASVQGKQGTYQWSVTQTTEGENGCEGPAEQVAVTILPNPQISITNTKTDVCDYDNPIAITTETDMEGGTYTYSGDAVAGENFVPTSATIGSAITVIVAYEAPNGCTASATKEFTVHHVDPLVVTSPVTQLESDYETVLSVTPESGNTVTWYDACETKVQLAKGASYSTGLVGEVSENFGVTQTDQYGCESDCKTIQVNRIKCPTPAPTVVVSASTICATDEVPTFTASGETDAIFSWYEDGVLVSNGATYSPTDLQGKAGVYAWTVTQTTTGTNGCEGIAAPVSLTINKNPEINVIVDEVICKNGSIVTPQSNLAGTVFTFDGSQISKIDPSQYAAGFYDLTYSYTDPTTHCGAVKTGTLCLDEDCLKTTIEIRDIPKVQISNVTKLINATDFTVTVSGDHNGTITWTNQENGQTQTGVTMTHSDVQVGSWNYCVTESDDVCTSTPACFTFSIIDCPVPAPDISVGSLLSCMNEDMKTFEILDHTYTVRWYAETDLSTPVAMGYTFTPSDIAQEGEYHYYATQSDGQCEGVPSLAVMTMSSAPMPKITGNKVICENETLQLQSDIVAYWYSDASCVTEDEVGMSRTVSYPDAGDYTLYVTSKTEHCTSNPVSVVVSVNPIPESPIVTAEPVCKGSDVVFTAVGENIQWYSYDIAVGEQGDVSYTVSNALPGVVSVEATQTVAGCESPRVEAEAIVYDIPSAPLPINIVICEIDDIEAVSVVAQSDALVNWYSDETLTQSIGTSASYTPSQKETSVFYVTQTINNCTSPSAEVTFTVNPTPGSVIFRQRDDIEMCEGNQAVIIADATNTIYWYDSPTGLPIFTGRYYTVPETTVGEYTYYASQVDAAGCEGPREPKTVRIVGGPTAPILVQEDTVCIYETPGTLIVSRNSSYETVSWISPSGGTLGLGDTLQVPEGLIKKAGIYTFKARTTVASCSYETRKEIPVTYVVYPKPSDPIVDKEVFCYDGNPVTLSSPSSQVMWYSESGSLLSAGTPTLSTMYTNVGLYTILMTQTENNCTSDTVPITIRISSIPQPAIVGKDKVCAGSNETYVVTKSDEKDLIDWTITGNRVSYALSEYSAGFVRSVDWIEEGFDTIAVYETNQYGCVGTYDYPVEVIGVPDVQFTAESLGTEGVITFTNMSLPQIVVSKDVEKEYHVDYYWDFGRKTDTALVLENQLTFDQTYRYGNYSAKLTAVNEFGCEASIVNPFFVDVKHGLFVPTAFSPYNPSASVRVFEPKGFNCSTFAIWIYDAWNNLVYYSEGVNEEGMPLASWDGLVNGKMMQAGTYRYKIEVTFEDHSEESLRVTQSVKPIWGNVVLIR